MKRPLRILVLGENPSFGGGSERMALEVAHGLAERGHAVYLGYREEGTMLDEYRSFAAGVEPLPIRRFGWRAPQRTIARHRTIRRFMNRERIDVILASDIYLIRELAVLQLHSRVPVLLHQGYVLPIPALSWRLARWSLAAVVTPSASLRDSLAMQGHSLSNVAVVSNWVRTEVFRPRPGKAEELRRAAGLPVDEDLILFVGRTVPEKGLDMLLRAFMLLEPAGKPLRLVIAGSNPRQDYLEKVREQLVPLGSQVIDLGCWNRTEDLYPAVDVVVMPSQFEEPFGLVALEAMSCEALLLASRRGALPEVLGAENADLLFPADDPAALAAQIRHWLERSAERKERGRKLRERVLTCFMPEEGILAYEQLMERLAGRSRLRA